MFNSRFAAAFYTVMVGFVALVLFLPQRNGPMLMRALFDAGHAPLFGLIAVLLLRTLRGRADTAGAGKPYGAAFALAASLGVASEAVQYFGPRDADALDLLRNLAGVTAFLMLALALDRSRYPLNRSRARRAGLAAGAAGILLAVGLPLTSIALTVVQRHAALPQLCDFEARWSRRLWRFQDATLHLVPPPQAWTGRATQGPPQRVARIDFRRGTYPGFTIEEPSPNWSRYETLAFDVFSELDSTVALALRIDDSQSSPSYEDRFNRNLTVHPGINHVRVALSDVRAGPSHRALDLTRVRRMVLFAVRPPHAFSLFLDDIRLE